MLGVRHRTEFLKRRAAHSSLYFVSGTRNETKRARGAFASRRPSFLNSNLRRPFHAARAGEGRPFDPARYDLTANDRVDF